MTTQTELQTQFPTTLVAFYEPHELAEISGRQFELVATVVQNAKASNWEKVPSDWTINTRLAKRLHTKLKTLSNAFPQAWYVGVSPTVVRIPVDAMYPPCEQNTTGYVPACEVLPGGSTGERRLMTLAEFMELNPNALGSDQVWYLTPESTIWESDQSRYRVEHRFTDDGQIQLIGYVEQTYTDRIMFTGPVSGKQYDRLAFAIAELFPTDQPQN